MKKVFICSPYRGDGKTTKETNEAVAALLCKLAISRGCAPYAPHLYLTKVLNDEKPEERQKGIEAGLAYLEVCDEVWICGNCGISEGMKTELRAAMKAGKPIKCVALERQKE